MGRRGPARRGGAGAGQGGAGPGPARGAGGGGAGRPLRPAQLLARCGPSAAGGCSMSPAPGAAASGAKTSTRCAWPRKGRSRTACADRVRAQGGARPARGELTQQLGQPPAEIAAAVAGAPRGRARCVAWARPAGGGGAFCERRARRWPGSSSRRRRPQPLRFGPMKSELKSRHEQKIHPEVAEAWIQAEIAAGTLFVRGDRLRRSGPTLRLTPAAAGAARSDAGGPRGPRLRRPHAEGVPRGVRRGRPSAAEVLQLMPGRGIGGAAARTTSCCPARWSRSCAAACASSSRRTGR